MFKDKLKGFISGVVVMTMVFGGMTVFAANLTKAINITYRDIKLVIDGATFTPKDGNGNIVEPFIYNGTTYLPVAAVSKALGKEVKWDGNTSTVYIGKIEQNQPDNYLDKLQHNDFKSDSDSRFYKINGAITDFSNNSYTNGLLFQLADVSSWSGVDGDEDNANIIISYPLNSLYSSLKGSITLPKSFQISGQNGNDVNQLDQTGTVLFYLDDKLVLTSNGLVTTSSHKFDLNIKGANSLKIKLVNSDVSNDLYIALTDLAMYK